MLSRLTSDNDDSPLYSPLYKTVTTRRLTFGGCIGNELLMETSEAAGEAFGHEDAAEPEQNDMLDWLDPKEERLDVPPSDSAVESLLTTVNYRSSTDDHSYKYFQ
eukprot:scaffold266255_cov50-Prasinocladus_malaysianus.AAC.1